MLQLFQVCTQGPFSFHLGDETRKFRENLLTVEFGTRIYRRPQFAEVARIVTQTQVNDFPCLRVSF